MSTRSPRLLIGIALVAIAGPVIALADWPAGYEIDPALVIDVTPEGFDEVAKLVPSLLPTDLLNIQDIADSDYDEECIDLIFDEWCWNWYEYEYSISNIQVDLAIDDVQLQPTYDALQFSAVATVAVNDAGDPIYLYANAEVIDLLSIGTTCSAWLEPVTIDLAATILMEIKTNAQGYEYLDVSIPPMSWGWSMSGDDFRLDDCALGDILDFFDWLGLNLLDLVIPLVEPTIDDLVNDFRPELEALIEEAFGAATIHEEFDAGDVVLGVDLGPSGLFITPDGMRLGMYGAIDAEPHPCVEEYGVDLSAATPGNAPPMASAPSGVDHHIGVFIDDDFVNQGLFAAWYGGLLCYDLDSGGLDIGIPINTALLSILAPGAFDELVSEQEDLAIRTRPAAPPTGSADGPYDINIDLNDLGLEFAADLDYRRTRLLNIDLNATIGTDLEFDGTTGDLAILLEMGSEYLTAEVTFNEYASDATADIEDGMAGMFESLVGPLIGGLAGDLAFALPAFEGLGLTDLMIEPAGSNHDWIGAYAAIGEVPYESTGCDEGGGCDSSGCDTGCSTGVQASGGFQSRVAITLFGLFAVFIRRREPASV